MLLHVIHLIKHSTTNSTTLAEYWVIHVQIMSARQEVKCNADEMTNVMHQKYHVYIRLTHLVGEFTAYKCGTKPQRLFKEGASHTIECVCIAQSKERNYIRHTYLLKGKTLCIQSVYMLGKGVFVCIRLV